MTGEVDTACYDSVAWEWVVSRKASVRGALKDEKGLSKGQVWGKVI